MEEFIYTTALDKIRRMSARIKVIPGGSSAGKTFSILPILADRCMKEPGLSISVVSESMPHLRRGAMRDFIKIMKITNRYVDSSWNRSNSIYNFKNGSYIEFFGVEDESKLRGARRNVLYVNECNKISEEAYTQLAMRTDKDIYLDYNPSNNFWVSSVIESPEAEKLILTYQDNEALPQSVIDFLESKLLLAETSTYWQNWCNVYLSGQTGTLDGVIFNNWSYIDRVPVEAELLGFGMDFGFTNDPSTCIGVYRWNSQLILDEVFYRKGLSNRDISALLKSDGVSGEIYADSAEPKSIEEIRKYGHRIQATKKGPDSIIHGISLLQEYQMLVTKRSYNLKKELGLYSWKKDKDDNTLNIPIDNWNHCFVGKTLITTINGEIPIKDVKVGDLVLTSNGFKPVIKKFNNGVKRVSTYSLLSDMEVVYLTCTNNHKIKTSTGWTEIQNLNKGNVLYQHKNLMVEPITYTQMNDTSVKEDNDYIGLSGNIIKEKYQKGIIFTTSTKLQPIIELKTSNLLKLVNILKCTVKKGQMIIQNGIKNFKLKVLQKPQNGIEVKKVLSGINNTPSNVILEILPMDKQNVLSVKQNSQRIQQQPDSVQIIVNQHLEEKVDLITYQKNVKSANQHLSLTNIQELKLVAINVLESLEEEVYDIMVEDTHEYFANGILVHNCIDGTRYLALMKLGKKRATDGNSWSFDLL